MARWASITDTAKHFAVSPWAIRKLIREGKMPYLRIGARYRIDLEAAEKFLQDQADTVPIARPKFDFVDAIKSI